MPRCPIHGSYEGEYCEECRTNAEDEESHRTEVLEQMREDRNEIIDSINNPGQYQCPHCLFRTLIRNASRCPKCRGLVDAPDWAKIFAKEAEKAQQYRIERAAAVAQARTVAEREAKRQKADHAKAAPIIGMVVGLVAGLFWVAPIVGHFFFGFDPRGKPQFALFFAMVAVSGTAGWGIGWALGGDDDGKTSGLQ